MPINKFAACSSESVQIKVHRVCGSKITNQQQNFAANENISQTYLLNFTYKFLTIKYIKNKITEKLNDMNRKHKIDLQIEKNIICLPLTRMDVRKRGFPMRAIQLCISLIDNTKFPQIWFATIYHTNIHKQKRHADITFNVKIKMLPVSLVMWKHF